MKHLLGVLLLFVISIPLFAAEEECVFDQNQQRLEYKKLEKQYPGSKYTEKENMLIIPRGNSQIHLRKGGCVHYGVTIELIQPKTDRYKAEKLFFAEIVRLVRGYGQGMADSNYLIKLLDRGKWNNMSDSNGRYYFVHYPEFTSFEIYQRNEDSQTIVGVNFYN